VFASIELRLLGFPATLIRHETTVLDRWLWLSPYLPSVPTGSRKLLDVGCGSGAFTIGAALRGYRSLGLSWDQRNQNVAKERAVLCKAPLAEFAIQDVRRLDERTELLGQFDVAVSCENIEHILDDRKLMIDMAGCLKPGGTLLLTTPYFHYRAINKNDDGPFQEVENGGHVRRGYTQEDLRALCEASGLKVLRIEYCTGYLSQKITGFFRQCCLIHPLFAWAAVLPLRPLPPLFDVWLSRMTRWPAYSIALVATRT
jgi:SAM-dependent methyltransferase